MSISSNVANLSITVVKTLVKMAGFGFAADMIDGAQECLNLLADIKNDTLGNPNAEMIRSLNGAVKSELDVIQDALKHDGLGGKQVKQAAAQLAEAARETIKALAEDDDALIRAVQQPERFAQELRAHAAPLPDLSGDEMQAHYETILDQIAEEFHTLAPWSPNFDRVAFADLLRCFPALTDQIARLEHAMQLLGDKVDAESDRSREADADTHRKLDDLKDMVGSFSPAECKPLRVAFGSRPDVAADDLFVARCEQEQLNSLIADPTRRRTVLVGMRGCGKTQLAASLAKQCEDANWNLIAWINAVSPDTIQSDLVELAIRLKIDTSDQPAQDVIVRRCLDHLKSATPTDRLIVFDNVEDINHLTELIPSGDGVRVIATTTNDTGWEHQGWTSIKVGVFDRSESINYLLKVTKSDDHDTADALAERLGYLPLAIVQAGATAYNEHWTLQYYFECLKKYDLARVIHPVPGDAYTQGVSSALAMAVDTAIEHLVRGTPETARRQLGALAVLAESGVPTRWLDPLADPLSKDEFLQADRDVANDAHLTLAELLDRSLVQQSADGTTIMLHRLQAQVLRESWTEKERRDANESSTALLSRVTTNMACENNTDSRRQDTLDLIKQFHTISVQDYSRSLLDEEQVRCSLEDAFAFADDLQITYETLTLQKVVETLQDRLGSDHPDVLIAHDNLAGAFGAAGRFDDAVRLYKQVIASRSRIQGDTHPDTLKSRNNLACIYRDAGKIAEAMAEHKLILAACIIALDIDDPQTLASRNNLAEVYWLAGNLPKAKSMFKQVEADSTRVLGTDDSQTLIARNNLAGVYGDSGEYTRAIQLFEQVIADRSRIHGDTHPETLKSRNNLACMYQKAGKAAKALAEQKLILKACTQALGKDHPQTIAARNNLANAYRLAGNLPKAKSIFEQVEADSTRVLGTDHPYTLQSRNNLAGVYRLAGDYTEAINLFEQVIADRSRLLGQNHPDTLTTRNNLAGAHRASGRVARAVNLYSQILNDCLRELHPHHPLTGVVRENLEAAWRELEQQEEDSANEEREQED